MRDSAYPGIPAEEDEATTLRGVEEATQGSVDVVYRHELSPRMLHDGGWRAIEICTRNRIYSLSARMRCVAVADRTSGEVQPDHRLMGARLVGGQKRATHGSVVSHPLPEVGMSAVFELPGEERRNYVETSAVIRVIIRQRVVTLTSEDNDTGWDDIHGDVTRDD